MTKKALYPYTLQPVALNITQAEFQHAQLALFHQNAQQYTLKNLRPKEWIAVGITVVLAVLGLILVSGYSTILFWLMLIGVGVYLLLRTLGLKWYMQKEYQKQIANNTMPEQISQIKLGIQPHGLIMNLPADMPNTHAMRGMTIKAAPMQQAIISWTDVKSWDETDDFIFILFETKGQQGSQIIPKRLHSKGFSIDTIKEHLAQVCPKGLKNTL